MPKKVQPDPTATEAVDWLRPSVHPMYARLLCAELRRRGIAPEPMLQGSGLAWDTLHTGQAFLSLAQLQRLVTQALALSGDPALGLSVGLSTELSSHGALGFAAVSADTLGQVLHLLPRFSALRLNLVSFVLDTAVDPASLVLLERLPDPDLRAYVLGHLTGAVLRLLQSVTGQSAVPGLVLDWPLPEDLQAEALRSAVPAVRTATPVWRLSFPRALLFLPTLAPDPEAHRLALQLCEQQLAHSQQGSVAQRVRLRLLACEGQFLRVEAMAELERVSARTLIRRLGEEGTRYQTLLDHTRADLACWWLAQTRLPVQAVAARLGFADTSNFSRSFRRWCGQTPRDYRAQHRPEAVGSCRADPRFRS
jgi:AraC-like DNA-binding protein